MHHIAQSIKIYPLSHLILYTLIGLSSSLQAATLADQSDTQKSYDYTLQNHANQVSSIQAEEKASIPSGQLLIPANGQCLYTTIVMGYLLPVRQAADEVTARIDQLFGLQPASCLNQLHQTLENPIHYLPYLHSDTFSSLVDDFISRMQIKKGTWGGPQEIQTIATKLKVNIQAYYPDPSNPSHLVKSDLTKPSEANADITIHIVQDKVHPREVLTQAEKASAKDSLHYQHYRLKYTLPPSIPAPVLPTNTQASTIGGRDQSLPYGSLFLTQSIQSTIHAEDAVVKNPTKPKESRAQVAAKVTPPISPQKRSTTPYLVAWFKAAQAGNEKKLAYLHRNYNINVHERNEDNNTALLLSAYEGHLEVIKYLIQQDANIHEQDQHGNAATLLSAHEGHLACVKYLIQQGADINHKNKVGYTPMLYSAREGHLEMLKYLAQQGADTYDQNIYGHTPLLLSAQTGHVDCLNFLLTLVDLRNINLQGINFSQATLPKNLSGLNFTHAKLPKDLTNHNLTHANLTGQHFTTTNFEGTQLAGAILTNTLCDYQQCFEDHVKVNKLSGGAWYRHNLPKDLKSIAHIYPHLSQDSHKAQLLQIASGLAYLPYWEDKEFYIKVYYWSCKLLLLKKQLSGALGKQLVCTLADDEYGLNYDAAHCCWQTDYLQGQVPQAKAAPHDHFDQYLKTFQAGLQQYNCQSKYRWSYDWYKNNIAQNIQGLQKTYPQLTSPKCQQEAIDIAFQLSTLYQHQHLSFLFHYLSLQNKLIQLKISADIDVGNKIHYNTKIKRAALVWLK